MVAVWYLGCRNTHRTSLAPRVQLHHQAAWLYGYCVSSAPESGNWRFDARAWPRRFRSL